MIWPKEKGIKSKLTNRGITLSLLFVLAMLPFSLRADLPYEQPGSRSAGLAYTIAALYDEWSLFHNQAGLGYQEHAWIGLHHENRFVTSELSFSAIGGIIPVKPGSFGISVKRLGFNKFSQTKFGVAYGMKLAPSLSAGVQLNAHHLFFAGEYGSTTAFTAEGGIIYTPINQLSIGVHVFNPTRTKLHDQERISTTFNLGIAYQISDALMVTAGTEKDLTHKFDFKAGVEFLPISNLYLRAGMASNPSLLSFGMGYRAKNLQVDFAFTRHEYLGFTPHFSLGYTFGRKKQENEIIDLAP